MLAPHAVDIHSGNLSNYYLTMFDICRTIRRHFSLRQVKLCIGQRKYKQKFTTQGSTDQASEFVLAYLTPILWNSRKKDVKNVINSLAYSFKSPPSGRLCQWVIGGSINKIKHQTNQLVLTNFWWQHIQEFFFYTGYTGSLPIQFINFEVNVMQKYKVRKLKTLSHLATLQNSQL